MLRSLVLLASCVAAVAASLQFCRSQRYDTAFLADVTAPLSAGLQNEFCDRGGTDLLVLPEDTGIAHYVLSGSLATEKLGKHEGVFRLLEIGEVAPLGAIQTPVSLHLWMRALCTGSVAAAVESSCSCSDIALAAYLFARFAGQTSLFEGLACFKRSTLYSKHMVN